MCVRRTMGFTQGTLGGRRHFWHMRYRIAAVLERAKGELFYARDAGSRRRFCHMRYRNAAAPTVEAPCARHEGGRRVGVRVLPAVPHT